MQHLNKHRISKDCDAKISVANFSIPNKQIRYTVKGLPF